jgi:hypothetical protein
MAGSIVETWTGQLSVYWRKYFILIVRGNWMPMAHACNPSYLARAEIVRIIV